MKVQPMPISEICKHLDINRDTFFKWIDAKGLLPSRLGHPFKFKHDDERSKNDSHDLNKIKLLGVHEMWEGAGWE